MHVAWFVCLSTTCSVCGWNSEWTSFFHTGKISEVYDQYSLTQPDCPPGLVAAGLNCSAHMLMISLLNAPTSTAKCIQLCMFMPRATNSLLTITRKGGCVRVYSSLDLNLGKSAGLFSLYTSLDVQIHTDTPVAETMLLRYLKIHPGFKNVRLHTRR